MKRERRQPTRAEFASITISRPVLRRVFLRNDNPTFPDAQKFFTRTANMCLYLVKEGSGRSS
jgi:hypothetical protein